MDKRLRGSGLGCPRHAAYRQRLPIDSWPFCWECYENLRGRSNHKGHSHYHSRCSPVRESIGETLKRIHASQASKKGQWSCGDKAFAESYPSLAQFLCDAWWDDGKPRAVGALSIKFGPQDVSIILSDPDEKCSAFTTGVSLPEAFELANAALANGSIAWRRWRGK